MTKNKSIDLARFIMSFFIICIHVELFKDVSTIAHTLLTSGLFRIAVPLFFALSGYFCYAKASQGKDTSAYLRKYARIYFITAGIIALGTIIMMIASHQYQRIPFILLRIFTVSQFSAYWYFPSLIYTLLLLIPLWRKKKILPGLYAGFLLYLLALPNDSWSSLIPHAPLQGFYNLHTLLFAWPQAGFMTAPLFLSLGAYIKENQDRIHISSIVSVLTVILFFAEVIFTHMHNASDSNCYITLIPLTAVLLMQLLKHPSPVSFDTSFLAAMSLYIYLFHVIFTNISYGIAHTSIARLLVAVPPTVLCSAVMTYLVNRFRKKKA